MKNSKNSTKETKKQTTLASAQVEQVTTAISKVEKFFSLFIAFLIVKANEIQSLVDGQRIELKQFALFSQFAKENGLTFTDKNGNLGIFGSEKIGIFAKVGEEKFFTKNESYAIYKLINTEVIKFKDGYLLSIGRVGYKFAINPTVSEKLGKNIRNANNLKYGILTEKEKEESKKASEKKKVIEEKTENGENIQVEIASDSEVETLKKESETLTVENVIAPIEE